MILTTIITLLIYICVLALVVYLIIWVLTEVIGISLPAQVVKILWVIVALVALLLIVQALLGGGLPRLGLGKKSEPQQQQTLSQKLAVPDIMVPEQR